MHKVKNRKVITRLSFDILKANRKKNVVIILAVMLTCILFTSLFSIGISMIKSEQESTMRQVGGKSMAGIKYILPEDYDRLIKDKVVRNPTYRIIIGNALNPELVKLSTEINYAKDKQAKVLFSYPTVGAMPADRKELATSTLVLDALGIPHEIGKTVPLIFTVNGKSYQEDFILCGYWEGDPVAMAQECWLSRAYCDEVAPTPNVPFYNTDRSNYSGYWMMDLDFFNSWNIEDKVVSLLKRNGYDLTKQDYGVNWAYTASTVDMQTVILITTLLVMILLSGYLIIFNVFCINVTADINKYGLLKTIGTTGKQLKRVVRLQALILSLLGIPLGLIIGTVLSRVLLPVIMGVFNIGNLKFSISPVIYILSGIFTFITVWIGSRKPCKLAAKVSPVEALHYTERNTLKKKEKTSSRVSTYSMAIGNIRRTRKKVIVVVLSLSLSMILLNSIYSIVHSLDMDKYASESIIGDFAVTDATLLNFSIMDRNFAGVSSSVMKELSVIDGVKSTSNIYCNDHSSLEIDDKCYGKIEQFVNKHNELFESEIDKQILDFTMKSRVMDCTIYGMDEWAFNNLKLKEGNPEWGKFTSGDYIIIYTYEVQLDEKEASDACFYEVGDKVSLKLPDDTVKEYEVMAIADVPYAMSSKSFSILGANVIIPEQEYLSHTTDTGALYSILEVADKNMDYVDSYLREYTTENSSLTYVSKQSYIEEFDEFKNMFWIVGGALCIILALIGILNFVNAIVTSLIARRQELAMLEAIGMTGKQLKSMLVWEGLIYAFITAIVSATFGSLVCFWLVKAIAGQIWFFSYQFTLMPIVLCLPVLVILSCIIPYVSYHGMCKTSVVDRLKVTL